MLDYVNHPDYMTVKNRKGLCFGISHTLEADEPENKWEEPKWKEHKFKFHFDD